MFAAHAAVPREATPNSTVATTTPHIGVIQC
jgi:hypothetical protein